MAANARKTSFLIACFVLIRISESEELILEQGNEADKAAHGRWNPGWSTPFPDRPIQLVKPDLHHKKLVLDEDNIKMLHRIKGSVATIAVVGKYHSGKSFLLNQLMGKSSGFGIGPYVRPQTMGLWMWGKPLRMRLENDEDVSVIFLDTEGFAATNVSENYDAKVFAVATLLSSYLVYNSVKIIDQSDIDYLEVLARRTQLFALRSQMSKAKWTDDFNHDLLSFPPLLWVVQDFVQMTDHGESPRDWLHRLMTTHAREKEDYEISLLGIFKSVDCQTLFLPAVTKSLLIDLSKAKEEDLTDEYKHERDLLIDTLKHNLKPKEKNNQPITGPEMATLLEILVTAANDGSLAEIPSRWDTFIERLENSATEDCLMFYDAEMSLFHKKHDYKPVSPSELELEAEEDLMAITLPLGSAELHKLIDAISNKTGHKYAKLVRPFLNQTAYLSYEDRLKISITNLGETFLLKNKQALEKILDLAVTEATHLFRTKSKNPDNRPLTNIVFDESVRIVRVEAMELFLDHSMIAEKETIFDAYLGMLKANLADEVTKAENENERILHHEIMEKTKELVETFRVNTDPIRLSLPMNDTDLETRLNQERSRVKQLYEEDFQDFSTTQSFIDGRVVIKKAVEAICTQRRHDNVEAFTREVNQPLGVAKQVIMLSADRFHTVFSLRQYILMVCLLNLNEGKPKHWPRVFKINVIDHYVTSDRELLGLVKSKEGLWSTIIGFFQWLTWLMGF